MMLAWSFILLSLLVASSNAANDWSTPCFSGSCQYDLPTANGTASGTVMIWGATNSISDITPAAGWEIIGCSPNALKQDIRLVCKDGSSAACAHLFDGTTNTASAVGKVVRLPENCGQNAFAVVTKSFLPTDQSIPASVASALVRRDGKKPTVRGLSLDTTFSAGTPSSGPVNFALRAANVPGANGDLSTVPQQQRRSNNRFMKRGISDFVTSAVNDISSLNTFNVNNSKTLPPVDVDKTFNLINTSISCPPVSAGLNIDVSTKAHAVVSIGVAAAGTIVPPAITSFALIGGLNANLDGSIDLQANATGTVDSGKIKLFEVGIPGLDIPGILTLGPSFELNGQATADLDLSVDMTVGVSYTVSNAQFVFPPASQQSTGGFNIGDTPLQLSAGIVGSATGTVTAHLIPTLNLGISALSNIVSANVFLELDASATMTLSADGSASTAGTVSRRAPQSDDGSVDDSTDGSQDGSVDDSGDDSSVDAANDGSTDSTSDTTDDSNTPDDGSDSTDSTTGDDSSDTSATNDGTDNTNDSTDSTVSDNTDSTDSTDNTDSTNTDTANASATTSSAAANAKVALASTTTSGGGCVELDGGFDVSVGADASFFGLFNPSTKLSLFNKEFEIVKKCFGDQAGATTRREILSSLSLRSASPSRLFSPSVMKRDGLTCLSQEVTLESIIDQIISASQVTQK